MHEQSPPDFDPGGQHVHRLPQNEAQPVRAAPPEPVAAVTAVVGAFGVADPEIESHHVRLVDLAAGAGRARPRPGRTPAVGFHAFQAVLVLAGLTLAVVLPFLLLSFANRFYRNRLGRLLWLDAWPEIGSVATDSLLEARSLEAK